MKWYCVYFHDGHSIEIYAENAIFRDDFSVTFLSKDSIIARFNLHEIAGYAVKNCINSCGCLWGIR